MNKIQKPAQLLFGLTLCALLVGGCSQAVTQSATNHVGSSNITDIVKPNGESSPGRTTLQVSSTPSLTVATSDNTTKHVDLKSSDPAHAPTSLQTPLPNRSGTVVSVSESGATKDLTCNGEDIAVAGSENKIILRGRVGKVDIAGSTNDVQVENAAQITINGLENRVRWIGSEPKIVDNGMENLVRSAKEASVARHNALPPAPKAAKSETTEGPEPAPSPTKIAH